MNHPRKVLNSNRFKGPLSGLRQFLTIEIPLKYDKKRFLFHFKGSFRSWDIYIFVLHFFRYVEKQLDEKAMVNVKIFWRHRLGNK